MLPIKGGCTLSLILLEDNSHGHGLKRREREGARFLFLRKNLGCRNRGLIQKKDLISKEIVCPISLGHNQEYKQWLYVCDTLARGFRSSDKAVPDQFIKSSRLCILGISESYTIRGFRVKSDFEERFRALLAGILFRVIKDDDDRPKGHLFLYVERSL
jgi:hypothetical protein